MDVKHTQCSDHFTIYTNHASLECIPETNAMLYVSYTLLFFFLKNKQCRKASSLPFYSHIMKYYSGKVGITLSCGLRTFFAEELSLRPRRQGHVPPRASRQQGHVPPPASPFLQMLMFRTPEPRQFPLGTQKPALSELLASISPGTL